MPTAKMRPPITVASEMLWSVLLTGRPQRIKAPGSETWRATAAPENSSAAARPAKSATRPTICQVLETPSAAVAGPRVPRDGLGGTAVARGFAAEGTPPLSATPGRVPNRAPDREAGGTGAGPGGGTCSGGRPP